MAPILSMPARYPKRKRAAVVYAEPSDEEGSDLGAPTETDEDEEDFGSKKKARKASSKTPPKKKAAPREKPFPFMSLPPELRNEIYKLALTDPNGVHIRNVKGWYHPQVAHCAAEACMNGNNNSRFFHQRWLKTGPSLQGSYRPVLVPALLATSKIINAEAAAMFWGQPFYVSDLVAMHTFLYRISRASLALMRDVTIISWPQTQRHMSMPVFNLLRRATNLESLTLYDPVVKRLPFRIPGSASGDSDRAKHAAKKLYRDLFPWLEAMVEAGGIEHLEKVLHLHEDNFQGDFYSGYNHHINGWTQERTKHCEQVMFQEFARIMEFDH